MIWVYLYLTGLAEWSEPSGGMFLWLKLHVPDTYKLITVKAREKGVLFVPGNAFMLDSSEPCPYVRASYSMSSAEQMDKVGQQSSAEMLMLRPQWKISSLFWVHTFCLYT